MLKKLNEWIDWPTLARVGNLPFVRATIITPFVAQVVVNAEHYPPLHSFLANVLNYNHLHWFFWSLVFLGIGQAIYQLFCPELVGKYRLIEDYINIRGANTTEGDLESEWWYGFRAHYKNNGGILTLPPQFNQDDIKRRVENFEFKNRNVSDSEREKIASSLFALNYNATQTGAIIIPDNDALIHIFSFPEFLMSECCVNDNSLKIRTARSTLSWYIHSRSDREEKRINALKSSYQAQRICRPLWRWLSVFFYTVGFTYFLYALPRNLWDMASKTYDLF